MAPSELHSSTPLAGYSSPPPPRKFPPQDSSPFFTRLPTEIRLRIYNYTSEGSVMYITLVKECESCRRCGSTIVNAEQTRCGAHRAPFKTSGPIGYDILLSCSAMYHEARSVIASSTEVCLSRVEIRELATALHKHVFLNFAAPRVQHVSIDCLWRIDHIFR